MSQRTSQRRGGVVSVSHALLMMLVGSMAFASFAQARTETLRWRAGTGAGDPAVGFVVYAGTSPGAWLVSQDVGDAGGPDGSGIYSASWDSAWFEGGDSLPSTIEEIDIYFAVKAYDADGEVSFFSNTILSEGAAPPPTNGAPWARIDSPAANLVINVGGSARFLGTAGDPDGDDMTYVWDFDAVSSGVPTSTRQDPGTLAFNRVGTFVVSFTATDSGGLSDATPDTVMITVVLPDSPPPVEEEPEEPTPEGPGVQQAAVGASGAVMLTAPVDDPRSFVVERRGLIRVMEGGALRPKPFLDLRGTVSTDQGQGLLGLAFDPDFVENGAFYTYHTDSSGDSVLSRFSVSLGDTYMADRSTEETLLVVDQPDSNNNGGHIAFGPDGFLYVGLGDGGGSHDPGNVSQDGDSLLGKILRIDVGQPFAGGSTPVGGTAYAIPSNNPFKGQASVRDEIWALGLRNPSRFSFDRETGDLWIADQGEDSQEEINFESAGDGGNNYGWDVVEGTLCNDVDPAPSPSCSSGSITDPIYEYEQDASNCNIVGGHVYRGVISDFQDEYFFADACSGRIWSRNIDNGAITGRSSEFGAWARDGSVEAVGFGEDSVGELYVIDADGHIYKLRGDDPECSDGVDNDGDGRTDYPSDPGCSSADSTHEQPLCDDDFDNDQDGDIDLDDTQCNNSWENIEAVPSAEDLLTESLCGLGAEIAFLLPGMIWLRQRRRMRRAAQV